MIPSTNRRSPLSVGMRPAEVWGAASSPASSISADHKRALDHELFDLLNGPMKFTPALRPDGTPINARMELPMYEIEVKDHKAKLFERKGC